jgi:hypothetical protein
LVEKDDFENSRKTIAALARDGVDPPGIEAEEEAAVTYFTVSPGSDLPKDFEESFRQRATTSHKKGKAKNKVDYTYKIRGSVPAPLALNPPPPCRAAHADVSDEWDTTIGRSETFTARKASLSCDAKAMTDFPGLTFKPRPCKISMRRIELPWSSTSFPDDGKPRKNLKVERWTFTNGEASRSLVEVSWKASASDPDEAAFRKVVKPLLIAFPDSQPTSKEKLAAQCDSSQWNP